MIPLRKLIPPGEKSLPQGGGPPLPVEQNSAPPNLSKNIAAKAKIATKSYKIARVSTKSAQDSHKNCNFLSRSVTKCISGPYKVWLERCSVARFYTSLHFLLAHASLLQKLQKRSRNRARSKRTEPKMIPR